MTMSVEASFQLPVGDGHCLWVQTLGQPGHEPVVVLHGGPGSGCSPRFAELYDPARQYVVLPDQRGAGRSTPVGGLGANTTAHLVDDLEALRRHLGIARWRVTGGSWGATLAIVYAAAHPGTVIDVLLRSVFIPSRARVEAFFAGGPSLDALAAGLDQPDPAAARATALAWWLHEAAMNGASIPPSPDATALDRLVLKYRLQAHYLRAGCFLGDGGFDAACARLAEARLPVTLIHGRDDRVCPPDNALTVHARLPGSRLVWVEGCGHDPFYPAMQAAWRAALRPCE